MLREVSLAKLAVGLVILSLAVRAENRIGISVIPKPNKIEVKSGEFSLTQDTKIILQDMTRISRSSLNSSPRS